eukprot:3602912-Rhodomonas_salina.2
MNSGPSRVTTRRWGKVLGVLLLAGLLVACGAAKGEKKGKGGGKGELKAKLLAEEGASALQRQDLVTAMEKWKACHRGELGGGWRGSVLSLGVSHLQVLRAGGRKEEAIKEYEAAISLMDDPRNKCSLPPVLS